MNKVNLFKLGRVLCWSFFGFVFLCTPAFSQSTNKFESHREELESLNAPINLNGKVLDQHGDPVIRALVTISITSIDIAALSRYTNARKVIKLTTDNNGCFEVNNETGTRLLIETIEKQSYEFDLSGEVNAKRGFDYSNDNASNIHGPDKKTPVIFYMRKKESPALVIPGHLRFNLGKTEYEVDLVGEQHVGEKGLVGKYSKDGHVDLQIGAEAAADRSGYVVTIQTPDKDSGLILSDKKMYVVPAEGYVQRLTVVVPVSVELRKYIYVKSREGHVYSRIDASLRAKAKGIYFNGDAWSNPSGARNVDYDPELYSQEVTRRNKEKKQKIAEREETLKLFYKK